MSFLSHKELSFDIGVEDTIEFFFLDCFEVSEMLNPAVAHNNIDSSKMLLRLLEEMGHISFLRDVGLDADCLDSQVNSLLGYGFGLVRVGMIVDHNVCAMRGQF